MKVTRGLNVLWADDEPELVDALVPSIADIVGNYSVTSSSDETLAALGASDFDLVLLDLRMPSGEWGGLTVLEQAGEALSLFPFIVLSGAGGLRQCVHAVRLGAADYVEKDFASYELRSCIVRVLSAWEAKRPLSDYASIRRLEMQLHRIMMHILKRHSEARGIEDIFQGLVPVEIALKTYERLILTRRGRQEEYLDLLDFVKILDKNWAEVSEFRLLETMVETRRKKDSLRLLEELNELRKIVAHPIRGELSGDDRHTLRRLESILSAWESALDLEAG